MYGLICLYAGFAIYLIIFFRCKKTDFLSKKITILLGIKLTILTVLYFSFFSEKMIKEERKENFETLIFR